ncbi:hypothetical protein RIF29_38681 [Crotalaria pallida]|uniref:Peptidase A1 domain-containing protein n=1 Tax=Crotalaria pallida TaxID=3830 RepID=A0AAN9DZU5_CROPI
MKEVLPLAIILFILSISSSSAESNGLSIDLIHRYLSPLSPNYNFSMTQSDFLIEAAFRSISRAKRFNTDPGESIAEVTYLFPNDADYLMQIFIGTPPVKTFAEADTGSDLSWIQCLPCEQCYKQRAPIFNPKKSTSYQPLSCESNTCTLVSKPACGLEGECRYLQSYLDNSLTVGTLATDTVSFNNSFQGRIIKYPKTIFGCGHSNIGNFLPTGEGIIGLGRGPLSLVTQLGKRFDKRKFSYCLLPLRYTTGVSRLKFAVDTQINRKGVVSTSLGSKYRSYYDITLTRVSINGMVVNALEYSDGDMIVDSGTTLTLLKSDLYRQVERAIAKAIDSYPLRNPPAPFSLCYRDGTVRKLPSITFQFLGSKNELKLYPSSAFSHVRDDVVCLLIIPTNELSILGNIVQLYHNVRV